MAKETSTETRSPLAANSNSGGAPSISAIVPARNEEAVLTNCVESLAAQPEIAEIWVVDDQSSDRTADIARELAAKLPQVRLLQTDGPPAGWVGKNNAVWLAAQKAAGKWLLFTDADAELLPGAASRALQLAAEHNAALVSFSPEQITGKWYEKALIPFVYLRLAKFYSYGAVNDPKSKAAAANGQFLMVRRDAYDAAGGHAALAGEILEDLALARAVKRAGFALFFTSGIGMVRVRMYRSFSEMWQGWKKNLFRLIGGTQRAVFSELDDILPWMICLVLLVGLKFPLAMLIGVVLLIFRQLSYGAQLVRNGYPFSFAVFYIPAVILYSGVLWASYRAHVKGTLHWKGREYQMEIPGVTR